MSYEAAYYQSQFILKKILKKILLDSFKTAIYLQSLLYDLAHEFGSESELQILGLKRKLQIL